MRVFVTSLLLTVALISGCVTNPVTGKREIRLVGEDWELGVGKQQYAPLRQMQGGDYVVDPGVEEYVRQVGNRLAKVADRKLPYEFHVINDSTPNAWALPGGKISINRGLLTELKNEAELAAVLGHEIVHAAAGHGAQGVTRGAGLQIGMAAVLIGTQGKVDPNIAQVGAGVGAQLINSKYGRDAERESDRYGMQYMSEVGYNPQGGVTLQQAFVRLSQGRQQDRFSQLFASHPASTERVQNNMKIAAALPKGGEFGRERYQRAMAKMFASREAYDKYDSARKAYSDGDTGKATTLVREAIRIEPGEGHFHSFLGDVARQDKKYDAAQRHYDRAIALNNQFFYYYLGRGKLNQARGRANDARRDLNLSMKLLPTDDAQLALGNIAKAQNDFTSARKHYQAVAANGGAAGDQAMTQLLDFDLAENPANYVKVVTGLQDGELVAQVQNPTPRTITGVQVQLVDPATGRSTTRSLNGSLGAKKSRILRTGIRLPADRARQIRPTVVRAVLAR